ncbi:hypothetical protein B0T17DRAFT_386937 [Bombardia bombarda]|uniref:Uncharacterized protein n=1 Tax=Bombardia bombarda TaxID=252184 RepID=A0AA39TUH3_9PEZI|nr:hypothetical protein B0T17DRAFT_386937 [Bombardia bombarda]
MFVVWVWPRLLGRRLPTWLLAAFALLQPRFLNRIHPPTCIDKEAVECRTRREDLEDPTRRGTAVAAKHGGYYSMHPGALRYSRCCCARAISLLATGHMAPGRRVLGGTFLPRKFEKHPSNSTCSCLTTINDANLQVGTLLATVPPLPEITVDGTASPPFKGYLYEAGDGEWHCNEQKKTNTAQRSHTTCKLYGGGSTSCSHRPAVTVAAGERAGGSRQMLLRV